MGTHIFKLASKKDQCKDNDGMDLVEWEEEKEQELHLYFKAAETNV